MKKQLGIFKGDKRKSVTSVTTVTDAITLSAFQQSFFKAKKVLNAEFEKIPPP